MVFDLIHAMDYLWAYWNNPDIQITIITMRLFVDIIAFVVAVLIDGGIHNLQFKKFMSR